MKKYNFVYTIETGTMWNDEIKIPVEINDYDDIDRLDIVGMLDDYFTYEKEREEISIPTYEYSELLEDHTDDEILECFMPINGGEYFIGRIVSYHWERII